MTKSIARIFCGLLVTIGTATTSHATAIYTALNPTSGWTVPALNSEIGNEVTAAGTDRYITSLGIEIYSQNGIFPSGTPGYADFRAQLYANNGAGGQPGSLLWQSAVETINYPGGLSLLTFSVPNILVPDTFTWTLQYGNTSPTPPALPGATAASVGGSDACWTRSPTSGWYQVTAAGTLMAQIQAVPEPGSGALLSAAFLMLWFSRRWKIKASNLG